MRDTSRTESEYDVNSSAASPLAVAGDSLSMVDIALRVWRYRRIMALVFIAVSLTSFIYAIIRNDLYEYSTALEIGSYMLPSEAGNGQARHLIEPPEQAKSKLEKRIVVNELLNTEAIGDQKSTIVTNNIVNRLEVLVSAESNIVEINVKGNESEAAAIIEVLGKINRGLIRDHESLMTQVRSQLILWAEKQQSLVASLKLERERANQNRKFAIKERNNTLKEVELVLEQIKRYDDSILRLEKQRKLIMERAGESGSVLAPFILEAEIVELIKLRDGSEIRAHITIPGLVSDIDKRLAVLDRELHVLDTKIKNENNALSRWLNISASAEPSMVEGALAVEAIRFLNLEPTKVVVLPHKSMSRVSIPDMLVILVGLVLGLLCSFFVALAVDFVDAVRSAQIKYHAMSSS